MCFFKTRRLGPHKKDTMTTKTRIDRLGQFNVHQSWVISFTKTRTGLSFHNYKN